MNVGENSCDAGDTNVGGIVWWRKKICSFTILCMFVKTDIQIYVSRVCKILYVTYFMLVKTFPYIDEKYFIMS